MTTTTTYCTLSQKLAIIVVHHDCTCGVFVTVYMYITITERESLHTVFYLFVVFSLQICDGDHYMLTLPIIVNVDTRSLFSSTELFLHDIVCL